MKSFAGFFGYALTFGGESVVSVNSATTTLGWGQHVADHLTVTALAVIGALIGSRLVGKIQPEKLRKAFGWFVLVMAVLILGQQIAQAFIS